MVSTSAWYFAGMAPFLTKEFGWSDLECNDYWGFDIQLSIVTEDGQVNETLQIARTQPTAGLEAIALPGYALSWDLGV